MWVVGFDCLGIHICYFRCFDNQVCPPLRQFLLWGGGCGEFSNLVAVGNDAVSLISPLRCFLVLGVSL